MNSALGLDKHPHSFLRVLLKNEAHSQQVFLLLTQKTADIPTTSVIRYLMRNRESSGRSTSTLYNKPNSRSMRDYKRWYCARGSGLRVRVKVSHAAGAGDAELLAVPADPAVLPGLTLGLFIQVAAKQRQQRQQVKAAEHTDADHELL